MAVSMVMSGCTQKKAGVTNTGIQTADPYFGKYPSTVAVSLAASTNQAQTFNTKGDSYANNIWTRSIKEDLNIQENISWEATAANGDYDQKLNLTMVSNNLPDIFLANYTQMSKLASAGKIIALDTLYQQNAYPFFKQCFTQDGGLAKSWGTIGGKLMGISTGGVSYQSARMIFIRHDWFVNSGLPAPKSMEDVINIAKTFKNEHPGTFALPLSKVIVEDGGMCDIVGVANSMGAYPDVWIDDGNGGITYGSIQPQMKNVLQTYQDLYKSGMLDPAFASIDGTKVGEELTSSKIGVIIGNSWLPSWPLNSLYDTAGVDWDIYPLLPSTTYKLMQQTAASSGQEFVCVSKNCKNPAAMFKILNYQTAKLNDPAKADTAKFRPTGNDHQGETPLYVYWGSPTVNEDTATHITQAIDNQNQSYLTQPQDKMDYPIVKGYIDDVAAGKKPTSDAWVQYKGWYGPNSAFGILNSYIKANSFLTTKVVGYQSPTMINQWSSLQKLELQYYTEIIANKRPVSDFDKFVSSWKSMGGDTISTEVNQWYKANAAKS